jgi:integrase
MGELLALRWGEVDFAAETIRVVRSFTIGGESSPMSGKPRSVPMVREVATALARVGQREHFTSENDLVFAGSAGGHLDSKEVRAEYKAALDRAGLRNLRFHDLRHTFGTRAVEQAESILELKESMGHANVQTTMRYLHYKSKADAAQRLATAFKEEPRGMPAGTTNASRLLPAPSSGVEGEESGTPTPVHTQPTDHAELRTS